MIRSLLLVPGHRADMLQKALGSGADIICADLEDSVPEDRARLAADTTNAFLRAHPCAVRIRPGTQNLLARMLVIPKVERRRDLLGYLGPLVPIIETAGAVYRMSEILEAPGVVGAIFGSADYAASLGVSDRMVGGRNVLPMSRFRTAREAVANACRALGIFSLDTCFKVKGDRDEEAIRESLEWSESVGFSGCAAIHPLQVRIANEVFSAGPHQEWADQVLAAHARVGGNVSVDDRGFVMGKPVARQAAAILERR